MRLRHHDGPIGVVSRGSVADRSISIALAKKRCSVSSIPVSATSGALKIIVFG